MEKIYMEENQEPRKRQSLDFSVVLSFTVAFFAIFSLAVYGIVGNQSTGVSYASDDTSTVMGDSFKFHTSDYTLVGGPYSTPVYTDPSKPEVPIFCVEHNVDTPVNGLEAGGADATYTRDGEIDDYGLLYLLNETIPVPTGTAAADKTDVQVWIKQVAIWKYLAGKYTGTNAVKKNNVIVYDPTLGTLIDVHHLDAEPDSLTVTSLLRDYSDDSLDTTINVGSADLMAVVNHYVEEANKVSSYRKIVIGTENGEEVEFTKADDQDFYQSSAIKVTATPTDELDHYSISITGIEGITIVDKDGQELSPTTVSKSVDTFFIRVPADKVTEEKQTLEVEVSGVFDLLDGHYYLASTKKYDTNHMYDSSATEQSSSLYFQRVISVRATNAVQSDTMELEIASVPDTGMNAAQTIYFIGLIVLLCGVGIIYANAKPVESKQQ